MENNKFGVIRDTLFWIRWLGKALLRKYIYTKTRQMKVLYIGFSGWTWIGVEVHQAAKNVVYKLSKVKILDLLSS